MPTLRQLKGKAKELRRRVSQSMSDAGPFGTTQNCKKMQKKLSKIKKKISNKKRRW